jgi:hypothetical protein
MGKRQREDNPSWWSVVVDEIRSSGGFVHSSLRFFESGRALSANTKIEPDTLVLRIPSTSLVSKQRALALDPCLRRIQEKLIPSELHTPFSDVIIALAMATQTPSTLPYLNTLPHSSAFDALPRRWPDSQIEELLKGSPLLKRTKKTKQGVRKDYDLVHKAWMEELKEEAENKTTTSFPSFQNFSDMLAAVSSRAFGIGDSEGDVAMAPILDLCDHCRGNAELKKNLSYQRLEDGSIQVMSTQAIQQAEGLRLTYGARGNSQLLLNYGFTLSRNLEPDSSSNDVLEFTFEVDGTNVVHLRTGPKSYTYGGFVKAIEQAVCAESPRESNEKAEEEGLEAFLNGCDDIEEVDIYGDPTAEGDEAKDDEVEADHNMELEALKSLWEQLKKMIDAYNVSGDELKERVASQNPSPIYYSAVLIQSELRTIYFFMRAAEKVEASLQKRVTSRAEHEALLQKRVTSSAEYLDGVISNEDLELVEAQTNELAQAFMKIRHGDLV